MSDRNMNWPLVGFDADPVPGKVSHLRHVADEYSNIASAVQESAVSLRKVTQSNETVSAAVQEFVELAAEVMEAMSEVDDRYSGVATEYRKFSNVLEDTQTRADAAYYGALTAKEDVANEEANLRWFDSQIHDPSTPPESLPALYTQQRNAEWRLSNALGQLESHRAQIQEQANQRDSAAGVAAAAIQAVIEASGLNDSWWDKVWEGIVVAAEWFLENVDLIETVLNWASIILTVIAVVLVFTGVGAPIAAALFMVARACNAIAKVLVVLKVAATAILVIDGKRPASDLVMLGVDLVVDKVVDKVVDGAGDRLFGEASDRISDALDPDGAIHNAIQNNLANNENLDVLIDGLGINTEQAAGDILQDATNAAFDSLAAPIVELADGTFFVDPIGDGISRVKSGITDAVSDGIHDNYVAPTFGTSSDRIQEPTPVGAPTGSGFGGQGSAGGGNGGVGGGGW